MYQLQIIIICSSVYIVTWLLCSAVSLILSIIQIIITSVETRHSIVCYSCIPYREAIEQGLEDLAGVRTEGDTNLAPGLREV